MAMAATHADDQPMLRLFFIVLAATTGCRRGELAGLGKVESTPEEATVEKQHSIITTKEKTRAKQAQWGRSRACRSTRRSSPNSSGGAAGNRARRSCRGSDGSDLGGCRAPTTPARRHRGPIRDPCVDQVPGTSG